MKKYALGLILLYFLPPPTRIRLSQARQPYLGPLDEVSALGLGATVAMAPYKPAAASAILRRNNALE
jgi:hypothetical protein